jgi:hypothetical protein
MRLFAIAGLGLYGVANVFAGTYDLVSLGSLAIGVDAALLVTGGLLLIATVLVLRGSVAALRVGVVALLSALVLAVFNERVFGLGQPSHHIFRGLYTIVVVWAVFKSARQTERGGTGSEGAV